MRHFMVLICGLRPKLDYRKARAASGVATHRHTVKQTYSSNRVC